MLSGSWKHQFHQTGRMELMINPPPEVTWKRDYFQTNIRSDLQLGEFPVLLPSIITLPSTLHHSLKDVHFRSLPNLCPLPSQETWAAPRCAGAASASWNQQSYLQTWVVWVINPDYLGCSAFLRQLCSSGSLFDGQVSCQGKSRSGIWEAQVPPGSAGCFLLHQPTTAHHSPPGGFQSHTRASWKATDTENKVLSWELPAFFFVLSDHWLGFSPSPRCWFLQCLKEVLC